MPAQRPIYPVTAREAVDHDHDQAERQTHDGKVTDQAPGLLLEQRGLLLNAHKGFADPAHLGMNPCALDFGSTITLHHQRAGVDARQIVTARPAPVADPSAATLRTGTDSPVSSASSTERLTRCQDSIRRDAVTLATTRTSPLTTSRPAIRRSTHPGSPSREDWTGREGPRSRARSSAPGRG